MVWYKLGTHIGCIPGSTVPTNIEDGFTTSLLIHSLTNVLKNENVLDNNYGLYSVLLHVWYTLIHVPYRYYLLHIHYLGDDKVRLRRHKSLATML